VSVPERDGTWRRARLTAARLYLCVGLRSGESDLERLLEGALTGGVDIVQLREKDAPEADLLTGAAVFRAAARRHGALFIVNDDPRLAVEAMADGVHVGQEDAPPEVARAAVGPERIVGRSTHSPEQFDRALGEDVDYLAIGPVHATPTKEGRPGIGTDPVRHAATVAERPWYVTGGMSPETAPEAIHLGAHGIVVVRAIRDAPDPEHAARELALLFR
jgi:thiamine-phosphate pyrophosphorylase